MTTQVGTRITCPHCKQDALLIQTASACQDVGDGERQAVSHIVECDCDGT